MTATVTLFGRPDCHLCDDAERLLRELQAKFSFGLVKVSIESDPKLEHQYRWAIPVVAVEGREVARAPIRAASLEAALREALGQRQR